MLLLGALAWAATAQILPAAAPTATRPVSVTTPPRSLPANAGETEDARVRDQLATHPISSQGVSASPLPAQLAAPLRVYDRHGRMLPGMKPAGANRVLDTGSGQYYSTVPSGDGQRIVP
ncbi:MAG: classical arabinogalactan protein 4 [Stenotrophomonas sp.]